MRRALFPLLAAALAVGCGGRPTTNTNPVGDPSGVTLTPITVTELDKTVASHNGKVVLIDCWFRGCAPCVEKFPRVMQLHRDFEKDGLVLITLDVYLDEIHRKDEVLKFLVEQQATCSNYIFVDDEETVYDWLKKYDATSTPAYVAFNRKGKRVEVPEVTVQGTKEEKKAAKTAAERAFVQKLLAEK